MKTTLVALAVASFSLAGWVHEAQSPRVPKGAVAAFISSHRISSESPQGRAGGDRVQAMQAEKAMELRKRQDALEATQAELAAATGERKSELQRQEQRQRAELQQASVQAQAALQALQREISLEIQGAVKGVLEDLLKESDVQFVLQLENTVVWSAPDLDLTTAVLEGMRARAPHTSTPE